MTFYVDFIAANKADALAYLEHSSVNAGEAKSLIAGAIDAVNYPGAVLVKASGHIPVTTQQWEHTTINLEVRPCVMAPTAPVPEPAPEPEKSSQVSE